jgi:hypothetical protein
VRKDEYTSSRSQGSRNKPEAHFVRFTAQQNARLHEAARRAGRTMQVFLHEAAIAAIIESENEQREREGKKKDEKIASFEAATPQGYGLRRRRVRESAPPPHDPSDDLSPEPEPPPPAQIVIAQAPTVTSEIDRLAVFVAKDGPQGERQNRLATAVRILSVSANSDAEKTQLARALDEKLLAIEGQKPASSSPFDFLESFLK